MSEPTSIQGNATKLAVFETPLPEPMTRIERVKALRGKYAWIPFSSDDHVREKHEELDQQEE